METSIPPAKGRIGPVSPSLEERMVTLEARFTELEKVDQLWTRKDVAKALGVSVRHVERLLNDPKSRLPRILVPGACTRPIIRFNPHSIKKWCDSFEAGVIQKDNSGKE